jgi:hypothetical protein
VKDARAVFAPAGSEPGLEVESTASHRATPETRLDAWRVLGFLGASSEGRRVVRGVIAVVSTCCGREKRRHREGAQGSSHPGSATRSAAGEVGS